MPEKKRGGKKLHLKEESMFLLLLPPCESNDKRGLRESDAGAAKRNRLGRK